MVNLIPSPAIAILVLWLPSLSNALNTAHIDINPDIRLEVGGVSKLDRSVFFTAHTTPIGSDWDGEEDKLGYFVKELNGHFGRDTGGISYNLSQVREDPTRPGYADPDHLKKLAQESLTQFRELSPARRRYYAESDMIIGAQLHPFWPGGERKTGQGWLLSTADTADEPLGTATGEYMGRYLKQFLGRGGQPKPAFVEVINEPLYELVSHGDTDPADVFRFHNTVADQIRKFNPGMKVGGYTMAFDWFERDDFGRWEKRFKSFIDIAGENMDFYSVHFYDFPGISGGKVQLRRGSNLEASFDLMDHYSELKLGQRKPYLISEYGSQLHDWFEQPWTTDSDWQCLKAFNAMAMQFMERPDQVLKAVAFHPPKAEWGRHSPTVPYYWRLLRRANEGDDDLSNDREGPWVWSEQIKFYELWSDVRGTRVDTGGDDPDVLTLAFVDGPDLFVALHNLSENETKTVKLQLHHPEQPTRVTLKHLYLNDERPTLDESKADSPPDSLDLSQNATAILHYRFAQRIQPVQTARRSKTFADTYLQPIETGMPITFRINGVETADHGEATLRLGIGRDHGHERTPAAITINGQPVDVPTRFRGDDTQADRLRFFGLLEVPVPFDLIEADNAVTITFTQTNGHVSSAALQITRFSGPIERSFAR